jgi:hypothetical protein
MANGEEVPRRIPTDEIDDELAEGWLRWPEDDSDVRGVGADRWLDADNWPWRVSVAAMEFVREEALEGELRQAMGAALKGVPGVTAVAKVDREVWVVDGDPSGEALVKAAAEVIDRFTDRIRSHMG